MIGRHEKYVCARRELSMRRSAYSHFVSQGRMKKEEADYEIAVMRAIMEDYAPQVTDLFGGARDVKA